MASAKPKAAKIVPMNGARAPIAAKANSPMKANGSAKHPPVASPKAGGEGTAASGKPPAKTPGAAASLKTAVPVFSKAVPALSKVAQKGAEASPPRSKVTGSVKAKGKMRETESPPVPALPIVPRKLPKGGPGKADLRRYRDLLIAMRRDLLASSRDLEAEVLKSSGAEFSVDHMADNGSDNYEQDFSLKLLEGEGEQLAEIRDALLKIDGKLDPPFGVCEPCVDEDQKLCPTCPYIPSARLDAMPHARMCVQTKELDEKRRA